MLPILVFALFVLLIDLYVYKGLKVLFDKPSNPVITLFFRTIYWLIPSMLLGSVILVVYLRPVGTDPRIFNGHFYIVAFTLMFYLPKMVFAVFHLLDDFMLIATKIASHIRGYLERKHIPFGEKNGGRLRFFSAAGAVLALIPFLAVIYGVAYGRFDFQVNHERVEIADLPQSFEGFRIVHISDLHVGSFHGHSDRVKLAVEKINNQEPDIIVFTGDLVNNFTAELDGFIDILSEMDARYGKYSILGNHDYGDYFQWASPEAKQENMDDMIAAHDLMGFELLLNEWAGITVNGESIALIGVENWGEPPFPRYGDLAKAMSGSEIMPVRILLSHDPSHWDAEVLENTGIDLTLSGHTHGMQFGIETGRFRWSPGQIKYPRWGGLYREGSQYLYVNRGLGYVAFPGRIGMPPEITVIELSQKHAGTASAN